MTACIRSPLYLKRLRTFRLPLPTAVQLQEVVSLILGQMVLHGSVVQLWVLWCYLSHAAVNYVRPIVGTFISRNMHRFFFFHFRYTSTLCKNVPYPSYTSYYDEHISLYGKSLFGELCRETEGVRTAPGYEPNGRMEVISTESWFWYLMGGRSARLLPVPNEEEPGWIPQHVRKGGKRKTLPADAGNNHDRPALIQLPYVDWATF